MSYAAVVIADSIGPNKARLTTMQLRMPRFILAQFNTHRAISKNARSSRAVPTEKLILEVETNPVIPLCWGKNRRGMQSTESLNATDAWRSEQAWLDARDAAVAAAHRLLDVGLHKQVANRLLEPFLWVDVVATATEWNNYFALRCHDDAQPEHRELAVLMARAYRESAPVKRPGKPSIKFPSDSWHLPYVADSEREQRGVNTLWALSVARCARVSYLAHDGNPSPTKDDLILHNKLRDAPHFSPFEHQGKCQSKGEKTRSGNFSGWTQYRQSLPKTVHTEFDFSTLDAPRRRGYVVEGKVPA
jgi:thymidylate synthase ThyX